MPQNIVACAYVLMALALGWLICNVVFSDSRALAKRVALSWMGISAIAFFSPHAIIFMVLGALLLGFACPKDRQGRFVFYIAMLPSLPVFVGWTVPIPGVADLIQLYFPSYLNLVLLTPLLLSKKKNAFEKLASAQAAKTINWVAALAICYVLITMLLDFRSTTLSNGVRISLDHLLSYLLLILAARSVAHEGKPLMENAIAAILISGVLVLCVGFMQDVHQWFLYSAIPSALHASEFVYTSYMSFRGGPLRVPGTMRAIPFGLFMALCISFCLYLALRARGKKALPFLALGLLFAWGMLRSDSRGAFLGFLVTMGLYLAYSRTLKKVRPLIFLVIWSTLTLIVFTPLGELIVSLDPYDTFTYRLDLVRNSSDAIATNPIIGSPDYLENPRLELSRNHEGLIDIVNAYLQVILRYGTVGLLAFALPLIIVLRRLLKQRKHLEANSHLQEELLYRSVSVSLIGYAVALATVSLIDRLEHYYWILLLICVPLTFQSAIAPCARSRTKA